MPEKVKAILETRSLSFLNFLQFPRNPDLNFTNRADFLFIPEAYSAKKNLRSENLYFAVFTAALITLLFYGLRALFGFSVLTLVSGTIALFYFTLMAFKLYVVWRSIKTPFLAFSTRQVAELNEEELPAYTVVIPLYREEKVIPQIIAAMSALDYPPEKLDVIITLEEYDLPTINAIKEAKPPKHFKTVILPNVAPKTKPKALNVAFLRARGEFLVIYDAEIIPDPDQLKKAYLAFREFPALGCLQTRLDHYNTDQNFLTKLFNAEFSFYYDLFLPGLQNIGLPIPLSGHSTHFRREAIKDIGAWDPYNVTEDCDLGMRLYRKGYQTAIIDSFSKEEATSTLNGWVRQRTRWMKGFIQTSLVHLRHPLHFKKELGSWKRFFGFLLIIPSTALINVCNLIYWCIFLAWITTHSPLIQNFFPAPVLYLSNTTFIAGNLIFTYLNLLGVYRRKRFNLVKFSALSPVYWVLLAFATTRAFVHIITKPHHWEKTAHGLHLTK